MRSEVRSHQKTRVPPNVPTGCFCGFLRILRVLRQCCWVGEPNTNDPCSTRDRTERHRNPRFGHASAHLSGGRVTLGIVDLHADA